MKKPEQISSQGIIFYDGLCILCSREIDHYRKQTGSENFEFVDITSSGFDPQAHAVDPFAVHKVMHVKSKSGELFTGVEAFRAIWKELPRYKFLHRWTEPEWVRSILRVGYSSFARMRPYLPRRKSDCESSPYCELKNSENKASKI